MLQDQAVVIILIAICAVRVLKTSRMATSDVYRATVTTTYAGVVVLPTVGSKSLSLSTRFDATANIPWQCSTHQSQNISEEAEISIVTCVASVSQKTSMKAISDVGLLATMMSAETVVWQKVDSTQMLWLQSMPRHIPAYLKNSSTLQSLKLLSLRIRSPQRLTRTKEQLYCSQSWHSRSKSIWPRKKKKSRLK